MMKISLILQASNRMSGPIAQATASVRRMGETIGSVSRASGGRIMAMNGTVVDAMHHFRRMAGPEGMQSAARSAEYFKRQIGGLTSGFSILKYASAAAVVGLGEEFVRGVVKAGGEVDQMINTLTRLEGTASKARSSLVWMQQFSLGSGARFTMPEIMGSYKQAINFGMHPRNGNLATMADTAAGEGVALSRIMFAVKDAMMGTSMKPLGNLGIKVHQGHGADGVNSYEYDRGGVSQHVTGKKGAENVLATLMRIMGSKYSGLGTEQAKTLPGGIAQLKNLLWTFEAMVAGGGKVGGKRGVYSWLLKELNQVFAWARKASADGSLAKLARQISHFMMTTGTKLANFISQTKWSDVKSGLEGFAAALGAVGWALNTIASIGGGGLSGLFNVWVGVKVIGFSRAIWGLVPALRALIPMLWSFGGTLASLVVAGGPVLWTIMAIGLVALVLYRYWAPISTWFKGMWAAMPNWTKSALALVMTALSPLLALPLMIINNWQPLTAFFKNLWAGISSWKPPSWMHWLAGAGLLATGNAGMAMSLLTTGAARPGPPRAIGAGPATGGPRQPMNGSLTVKFENAPAGTRVTEIKKPHPLFDIAVRNGAAAGMR